MLRAGGDEEMAGPIRVPAPPRGCWVGPVGPGSILDKLTSNKKKKKKRKTQDNEEQIEKKTDEEIW